MPQPKVDPGLLDDRPQILGQGAVREPIEKRSQLWDGGVGQTGGSEPSRDFWRNRLVRTELEVSRLVDRQHLVEPKILFRRGVDDDVRGERDDASGVAKTAGRAGSRSDLNRASAQRFGEQRQRLFHVA